MDRVPSDIHSAFPTYLMLVSSTRPSSYSRHHAVLSVENVNRQQAPNHTLYNQFLLLFLKCIKFFHSLYAIEWHCHLYQPQTSLHVHPLKFLRSNFLFFFNYPLLLMCKRDTNIFSRKITFLFPSL